MAGALVVNQHFIADLKQLLKCTDLHAELKRPDAPLVRGLGHRFFATGAQLGVGGVTPCMGATQRVIDVDRWGGCE